MDRREALRRMVLGSAGAVCAAGWVERLSEVALAHAAPAPGQAAASAAAWTPRVFTPHQNATVIEISELIIPQTDTAGARAAEVNRFIDTRPWRMRQPPSASRSSRVWPGSTAGRARRPGPTSSKRHPQSRRRC